MKLKLELAIAALEDLRDDLHKQSNEAFFNQRFVLFSDFGRYEQSTRNALQILRTIYQHEDPVSLANPERLAS